MCICWEWAWAGGTHRVLPSPLFPALSYRQEAYFVFWVSGDLQLLLHPHRTIRGPGCVEAKCKAQRLLASAINDQKAASWQGSKRSKIQHRIWNLVLTGSQQILNNWMFPSTSLSSAFLFLLNWKYSFIYNVISNNKVQQSDIDIYICIYICTFKKFFSHYRLL